MSDRPPTSQPPSDVVTTQPPTPTAPPPGRHPRRPEQLPGIYDWLIPVVLIFLALALGSIILASLAAMLGLWPVH